MKGKLMEILKSRTSSLHVFDIDDTLVHSSAKIHVKNSMGDTIQKLSTSEYNSHILSKGCHYDYCEFRSADIFHRTTRPIRNMIRTINAVYETSRKNPKNKTIINTARSDFDDREKFLGTLKFHGIRDIEKIHVHRSGNLPGDEKPAEKKLVYIRKYLENHSYTHVRMYDDSYENLNAFLRLKEEYPDIFFHAYHVDHQGKMSKYLR